MFLVITYEGFDVLINSSQIRTGASLGGYTRIERSAPYFDRVAPPTGGSVFAFDLAGYLSGVFAVALPLDAPMILLANTSSFSEAHQRVCQSMASTIGSPHATHSLGLSVKAEVKLAGLPLRELRPLPTVVRTRCVDGGLLAFRFGLDGRIQYLFDIETVLFGGAGLPPGYQA